MLKTKQILKSILKAKHDFLFTPRNITCNDSIKFSNQLKKTYIKIKKKLFGALQIEF